MSQNEIPFQSFDPQIVTQFLLKKDYDGCWNFMIQLLESFSTQKNAAFNMQIQEAMNDAAFKEQLEKFSSFIGGLLFALFIDTTVKISDDSFIRLMGCHEEIHNFLTVHGVQDTDNVVQEIIESKRKLSSIDEKKALLLLSLDTNLDIIEVLKKMSGRNRSTAVNSYLIYKHIFRKNVHENKIKLIKEMGHYLRTVFSGVKKIDTIKSLLMAVSGTYFSCSYIHYDDKHSVRKYLNDAIMSLEKKFVRQYTQLVPALRQDKVASAKPRLLVVLEAYGETHVMRRCYDSWLKACQDEFDVTLCVVKADNYPQLEKDYNVIFYYSSKELLDAAYGHKADIVLFPSVGLTYWGILASNLRIAPVQVMYLGQPATTKSKNIDFVYGPEECYNERAFPTDRYVAGHARYKFGNILSKNDIQKIPVKNYDPSDPRPLRVSIVGSAIKTTYPFLKLLREIRQESSFDIEFIFHLNSTGMEAHTFREHLKTELENVTLYGFQPYEAFLESIGKTDIVLNPFPFGHTNIIIDTLLLGKPCVSYFGIEPSSRTEHYVLSLVDLVEKFEVTNQAEYKQKFQELAAEILQGKTEFYDRSLVYDALVDYQEKGVDKHNPGKELKWLYDHADEMKKSGDKFFRVP